MKKVFRRLRCRRCGSRRARISREYRITHFINTKIDVYYFVICRKCGLCTGLYKNPVDALKAWYLYSEACEMEEDKQWMTLSADRRRLILSGTNAVSEHESQ